MEPASDNHQLLREYLLGRLNAPARERQRALAEEFFEDEGRYGEMTAVEDELLEQYLNDELSPEDRAGFVSYLAHLPAKVAREKLAFAQALSQAAARYDQMNHPAQQPARDPESAWLNAGAVAVASPDSASWWQQLWPAFSKPLAWRYSFAAAALLLGATLAWLLYSLQTGKQLQAGLDQRAREREQSQQKLQNLQRQFDEQRQENERLQAELKRAREESDARSQELARLQAVPTAPPLIRGNEDRRAIGGRDKTQATEIRLRAGARTLNLRLQIPKGEAYRLLEARLTETDRQRVAWKTVCEPVCAPATANQVLMLELPAEGLNVGPHTLSLILKAADGLLVQRKYDFTIVKR
jgi:hypothetical protein